MRYSAELLKAIGEWQNGWGEDAARRLAVTDRLREAIAREDLPEVAMRCTEICYRKRFLVPNNPQNGGDLKPLLLQGAVEEGVASWTTDLSFAKEFKEETRLNSVSAVFAHAPAKNEVLLNVKALWGDPEFAAAVAAYADSNGEYAAALRNFRALQSEVILDAPLLVDEVEAFCGRISEFIHLCDIAGLATEEQQDDFWRRMVQADTFPGDARWLDRKGAQRVIARVKKIFVQRASCPSSSVSSGSPG